ncbi:hypothetical protein KL942_002185 [Ogataea angusta]|uniref:C2 domain-containing protein n=1 Tax=Pichia angusta TaxID=870730 RepID=A0AAN6I5I9_PICAN|nr:uncharacterized protein KL928_001981 [Ogataea angusta]KAG7819307.1 hypothetical protein KL928_001981 [Ogataea angusta]KAG7824088.1 hypothetical protein KL909_002086 [Ogataea angusta]KAG7831119.1 hypothetical protein KL920_001710 [Ogataea angusta]KAG7840234.1 hypothetical protein KL942_002185 [Ogataea angusta]KAG7848616.1 hypothetical protein KL941_001434 [Ogataea angusta]
MNDSFRSSNVNSARLYQPSNQLVIIVSKAQDLPNRKKLDKQSPYCVARVQDQVQKTKIVHRGGQNPIFDDELWFSLDNVEETTVNFIIYHQLKKDSELVCKADIDFTPALRRSSKEGYDNWFSLSYNGRPAGKIYLEMTYYSSSKEVPANVEPLTKSSRTYSSVIPQNLPSTPPAQSRQPFDCDGMIFRELNYDAEDKEVKRTGKLLNMSQSFGTDQNSLQRLVNNAWRFSSAFNKPVTQATVIDLEPSAHQPRTHLLTHKLFEDSSDEDELEPAIHQNDAKENQAKARHNLSDTKTLQIGKSFLSNLVFGFDKRENSGIDNTELESSLRNNSPLLNNTRSADTTVLSEVDQEDVAPEPPSHRVPLTQMNRPLSSTDFKTAFHSKDNEHLGSEHSYNRKQYYNQSKSDLSYSQIRKLQRKR